MPQSKTDIRFWVQLAAIVASLVAIISFADVQISKEVKAGIDNHVVGTRFEREEVLQRITKIETGQQAILKTQTQILEEIKDLRRER